MTDIIDQTAAFLRQRLGSRPLPLAAVILGSGLGPLADHIDDPLVIPYPDIPNFRRTTAIGHKGNLIFGSLAGRPVMAMQGRFHFYEGCSMLEVTFPVRVMAALGIRTLFVSNAAGALNPSYRVGDLMVISDHISFMPNPLIGPNFDRFGPRFPDMTTVYSPRLRDAALRSAASLGLSLRQGVYVAETGPAYETPAEYRMFAALGGDAVGMSTVPEVIVARHCGMEVFGISVITNQSHDLGDSCLNDGDDVIRQAALAAEKLTALFRHIFSEL